MEPITLDRVVEAVRALAPAEQQQLRRPMAVYFLKTSALVKRYAQETGTAQVHALANDLLNVLYATLYAAQVAGIKAVAASHGSH